MLIIGGAAATECQIGQDLETNTSDSFTGGEGFYLLTNRVPCDGRVMSMDLCALLDSTNSDSLLTVYYFFAALYRPKQINNKYIFERISEPGTESQLQITAKSVFKHIGSISCARVSLTLYNWTAAKGDIIGVSFSDYSCETQIHDKKSYRLCPVHAALQTNSSSDTVYFSEHLDTNHSTILLDELNQTAGVKITIKVIVGQCLST